MWLYHFLSGTTPLWKSKTSNNSHVDDVLQRDYLTDHKLRTIPFLISIMNKSARECRFRQDNYLGIQFITLVMYLFLMRYLVEHALPPANSASLPNPFVDFATVLITSVYMIICKSPEEIPFQALLFWESLHVTADIYFMHPLLPQARLLAEVFILAFTSQSPLPTP